MLIYSNDHRPAHVHVQGAAAEAVLELNCPDGPVRLRENFEFTSGALRAIAEELDQMIRTLCDRWEAIHGDHG